MMCLDNSMGLEINKDNVKELVDNQRDEIETKELKELHNEEADALKKQKTFCKKDKSEYQKKGHGIPKKRF